MKQFIYNARLVDEGMDSRGSLLIEDGRISAVFLGEGALFLRSVFLKEKDSGCTCIDAEGKVLMPSFIDMHAHFRDPGQLWKEELNTGLKAAAAGGFGTLVLMPNTDPVISEAEQAEEIRLRAASFNLAEVYQTVSLTSNFDGQSTGHLDIIDPKHIPLATEDGRDVASAAVMLEAMQKCSKNGVLVSCHSEDPSLAAKAKTYREKALKLLNNPQNPDRQTVLKELQAALGKTEELLRLAEDTATQRNLTIAAEAGCRIHIAHVSTEGALNAVRRAKANSPAARISCEVTPHHIALTGTISQFVNPPLRPEKDRQALVCGIADGTVDVIATDHAPHSSEDKAAGAPGFSGLETAFAVCYSILVQSGRISLSCLSRLMSANPARILHLNRGILKPGCDADLVLVDPARVWTVKPAAFLSRGKNTPFAGESLTGKVVMTIWHGRIVHSL